MNTEQAALNVVVGEQYKYCGHVYVVVGIYEDSVALASTRPPGRVCIRTIERLHRAAKQGRFTFSQAAPFSGREKHIIAALNAAERAKLTCCLANTEPAVKEFSGSLPRDGGTVLTEAMSYATGNSKVPSYETVRNALNRALNGDGAVYSLMPFKMRPQNQWDRLPEVVRATIERCLVTYFYIRGPECLSDVIASIQASLEEYNRSRPATDKINIPSRSTLRRRIGERSEVRRLLTQKGHAAAAKAFASNTRHCSRYRLLEHIESDTHVLDLELVDDQGKPIGKAALTLLLDVGSRTVVGWDISVKPAPPLKSMRALKSSLSKCGLGKIYVLDNRPRNTNHGELDRGFAFLGLHITYGKTQCTRNKPCVERWFRSLTSRLPDAMRGSAWPTLKDCDDYPWPKVRYTSPAVRQRFAYWLGDGYPQPRHTAFSVPAKLALFRLRLSRCRCKRAKR